MQGLIYLASPYTHADPAVQEQRYQAALIYSAKLFRAGLHIFSPIVHCHPISLHGLPGDIEFWQSYCDNMLDRSDSMLVLALDGWRESAGINHELRRAHPRIPIVVCDENECPQKAIENAAQISMPGV